MESPQEPIREEPSLASGEPPGPDGLEPQNLTDAQWSQLEAVYAWRTWARTEIKRLNDLLVRESNLKRKAIEDKKEADQIARGCEAKLKRLREEACDVSLLDEPVTFGPEDTKGIVRELRVSRLTNRSDKDKPSGFVVRAGAVS